MKLVIKSDQMVNRAQTEIRRQFEAHREKGLLMTLDVNRPPKTTRQLGKLHSMLAELADHLGYTRDELKAEIKASFGPFRVSPLNPDLMVPKSWRDISREEAGALIEHLYRLGAEYGCAYQEGQ